MLSNYHVLLNFSRLTIWCKILELGIWFRKKTVVQTQILSSRDLNHAKMSLDMRFTTRFEISKINYFQPQKCKCHLKFVFGLEKTKTMLRYSVRSATQFCRERGVELVDTHRWTSWDVESWIVFCSAGPDSTETTMGRCYMLGQWQQTTGRVFKVAKTLQHNQWFQTVFLL